MSFQLLKLGRSSVALTFRCRWERLQNMSSVSSFFWTVELNPFRMEAGNETAEQGRAALPDFSPAGDSGTRCHLAAALPNYTAMAIVLHRSYLHEPTHHAVVTGFYDCLWNSTRHYQETLAVFTISRRKCSFLEYLRGHHISVSSTRTGIDGLLRS